MIDGYDNVLLWVLLAAICLPVAGYSAEDVGAGDSSVVGQERESDLRVKVTIGERFPQGTPIDLKVSLWNAGSNSVPFVLGLSAELCVTFEVRDERGKEVRQTLFGMARELRHSASSGRRPDVVAMRPGQSFDLTFDLCRFFDLSLEGAYTIRVMMPSRLTSRTHKALNIQSPVHEFRVTKVPIKGGVLRPEDGNPDGEKKSLR